MSWRKLVPVYLVTTLLVMVLGLSSAFGLGRPVRAIVVFEKGSSAQARTAALTAVGGKVTANLPLISGKGVLLSDGAALRKLAASSVVKRVDPDIRVSATEPGKGGIRGAKGGTPQPPQVVPWGISRIKADQAWAVSAGSGVKVAVIDTGIDLSHPDLRENIKGGYNAINPRKAAKDDNGHGTHVAGTIAAVNNSIGVVGVAPSANLYSVKVLGANGSGWLSDVIEGIQWSVANGMHVANMSLGASSDIQSLHDAVSAAKAAGVTVVAAAGNESGPVIYPAAYDEAVAVSATNQSDGLAAFSNYGPQIDLGDPGVEILSTYKGGVYATMSGTSMAAPHVSGSAALVIASGLASTPDQVKSRLEATAFDLPPAGWDAYFGAGLVDSLAASTP